MLSKHRAPQACSSLSCRRAAFDLGPPLWRDQPRQGSRGARSQMASQRYTLAQAAQLMGLSVNGVRTRYKRGRLDGGKDNASGEIFVYLDPGDAKPEKPSAPSQRSRRTPREKPSQPAPSQGSGEGLAQLAEKLADQLARTQADHAAERAQLVAQVDALRAALDAERDRRHVAELRAAEGLLLRLMRAIGARS